MCSALMVGLTVAAAATFAWAEAQPPPEGGRLPEFRLAAPKEPEELAYLGVKAKAAFRPADVQAEVLIIEIFNMY
jgi:hypothetical protein